MRNEKNSETSKELSALTESLDFGGYKEAKEKIAEKENKLCQMEKSFEVATKKSSS